MKESLTRPHAKMQGSPSSPPDSLFECPATTFADRPADVPLTPLLACLDFSGDDELHSGGCPGPGSEASQTCAHAGSSGILAAQMPRSAGPEPAARAGSCLRNPATGAGSYTRDGQARRQEVVIPRPRKRPLFLLHIKNKTALRLLYIPLRMHAQFGLGQLYSQSRSGCRKVSCAIQLRTQANATHRVIMMTVTVGGKPYPRLAAGWDEFCEQAGVCVGDAVTGSAATWAPRLMSMNVRSLTKDTFFSDKASMYGLKDSRI